ncbi:hypothetical protein BVI1335_110031 [Burkholderia vietnamiensis]|nr:hypothetical protein BVI1335_110031 [Burkholderia vietnamiensis]
MLYGNTLFPQSRTAGSYTVADRRSRAQ